MTCQALNQIFEDRFVFEEGAYRAYATDEKTNIDQKDDLKPRYCDPILRIFLAGRNHGILASLNVKECKVQLQLSADDIHCRARFSVVWSTGARKTCT